MNFFIIFGPGEVFAFWATDFGTYRIVEHQRLRRRLLFRALARLNMGLVATKPVFGVSDKARLKPVSSATETS